MLLLSLQPLSQQSWAGQLTPVAANEPFWASSRDAPGLVAAGQAVYAPAGTIAPQVEPAFTAHGSPGFAAGTSNATPPGPPVISAVIDGGGSGGSRAGVLDGGRSAPGYPAGTIDEGGA